MLHDVHSEHDYTEEGRTGLCRTASAPGVAVRWLVSRGATQPATRAQETKPAGVVAAAPFQPVAM